MSYSLQFSFLLEYSKLMFFRPVFRPFYDIDNHRYFKLLGLFEGSAEATLGPMLFGLRVQQENERR
jgi:hypothetical protein